MSTAIYTALVLYLTNSLNFITCLASYWPRGNYNTTSLNNLKLNLQPSGIYGSLTVKG